MFAWSKLSLPSGRDGSTSRSRWPSLPPKIRAPHPEHGLVRTSPPDERADAAAASRAAELYGHALDQATTPESTRAAKLGELCAAIEMERPDAPAILESLGSTNSLPPTDRVILVNRRINLETRYGLPVSFDEGHAMWQLLGHVPIELLDWPSKRLRLCPSGGWSMRRSNPDHDGADGRRRTLQT